MLCCESNDNSWFCQAGATKYSSMISRLIFLVVPAIMLLACGSLRPELSKYPVRIQNIPVTGRAEAKEIIDSRLRFLKLTYEHFFEPDYLTSKTGASCREQNLIGEVEEHGRSLFSVSRVFLGPDDISGFCPHHSQASAVLEVFIHCENDESLTIIRCSANSCSNLDWKRLC
jgi:hypothetical protein